MNYEAQIKLQAYLDGELTATESRQVEELLVKDSEARAILGELRTTGALLAGHVPEYKVPESREFYWSKIQTAIEKTMATAPVRHTLNWMEFLRRAMLPVSGLALVCLLAVGSIRLWVADGQSGMAEVENVAEGTDTVSFRNHAENMFVVWVVSRDTENEPKDEPEDEMYIE
jgi:anti-sigma factor RsiW